MSSPEDMLQTQTVTPNRALNTNFTERVLMGINERAPLHWTDKVARNVRTKLGLGVVGSALLLSGTAVALTLWPSPTVTKTTHATLASGNHIVGFDTTNCDYFSKGIETGKAAPVNEKIYYEIRQGSKLTDTQLQDSLKAVCEENVSNTAITTVEKSLPANKQGDSSEAYTVTAISADSITVSVDAHYSDNSITRPNQTYRRFDSSLAVYDQSILSSFSKLKVGDTIKMITKDTSGQAASATYEPTNHPENQMVEAIVKIPALTGDPSVFYTGVAKEFVRVDPCTASSTGFCRAYDFVK